MKEQEKKIMETGNTKDVEVDLEQTGDKVVGGMRLSDLDAATGETTTGRRGRGHGSSNGITEGRGQKGREARSGGQRPVLNAVVA